MPETPVTPAQLALEQSGLEFLRNGKFRKARDAFKSLNKLQPSRALPLLIEANLGLANEMMAKGQVSEANQVLAYLKTIAPATSNLTLTPVAGKISRDAWSAMVPLAAQRLGASTQPAGRIHAADEMILGAESPDHPGHPDAKAILTALEIGYGSAASEQTTPLLRSVPRSSPFSHWVIFFKGMTAFEAGDHARAADCFRRVPENSLLQASIPALLTLCGAPATTLPTSHIVHALCTWAGHPTLAEPLLQAEPLWRKKQRTKALSLLTKKIPGLFCNGAKSFNADLTRFLTSAFVHTHLDDINYGEALLNYASANSRNVARGAVDQAFFALSFADYSGCAHRHFRAALAKLKEMSRSVPLSPAMQSRIFTNLAEAYIADVKNHPNSECSGPNAKMALEHAIQHDPDNLRAWLMQCDLLSMGRDTSAYHRFLDDLSKRFPTHKEVLIRNGDCCVERNVYTKALRNFESAAKLDSVDPRIARGILRAHLGIAEDAYKKRRSAKVNWESIESLASTNPSCAEHSLWRLRVRRIVLEARQGMMTDDLVALSTAAQILAPSAFLLETACRFGIVKFELNFKEAVLEKMFPTRPSPSSLGDFLAVIDEVEALEGSAYHASAGETARKIFAAHEALLLRFVVDRKDLITLLIKIFSSVRPNLALVSPVIQKWYPRHPDDPLLRFLCATFIFPWLTSPPYSDPRELATHLHDSHDPDDRRLLILFQKHSRRITAARYGENHSEDTPKLDLNYNPHAGDDEFDDEDDDDFLGDDFAEIDQAIGKMSAAKLVEMLGSIMGGAELPRPGKFIAPFTGSPAPSKPPQKRAGSDSSQMSFDAQFISPPKPPQP